jgi:SAM-dependent MidA family methyltransferase
MNRALPYDPEARRATPLARVLEQRMRRDGPISVRDYMHACLQDEAHGYYRTRTAIGAAGDFITAPEISQVFGELIGLWCAVVWQQMRAPTRVNLVELGPGRGTLMRDALRAAKVLPGFLDAVMVHLVESSATLREIQAATLCDDARRPTWHDSLETLPGATPTIVVANELLDALPIRQLVASPGGLVERMVGLDDAGRLVFLHGSTVGPPPDGVAAPADGELVEIGDFSMLAPLGGLARRAPVAGLCIDYGHWMSPPDGPIAGETLQAVRHHAAEHPLTSPGEADLTAHVDFAAFGRQAARQGFAVDGPVTQAEFLGSLGILQRASRLMAANPAKAHEIEAGVARLMAVPGMGNRFKAIGIRSAGLAPLPGFPTGADQ